MTDFCLECGAVTRVNRSAGALVCGECGCPYGFARCSRHHVLMEPAGRTLWGSWRFACPGSPVDAKGHIQEVHTL